MRKLENEVGKEYMTSKYGPLIVTEYRGAFDVSVKFLETGYETNAQIHHIRKGQVKDPFAKTKNGVGFIGIGPFSTREGASKTKEYEKWSKMFDRCYCEAIKAKFTTYADAYVQDVWHNYQEFAEWCNWQVGFNNVTVGKTWELDKDLLFKGNKSYGPETCVFLPEEINKCLVNNKKHRGDCPVGVSYRKDYNFYVAQITINSEINYLGTFKDPLSAFMAYKEAKELRLKELAIKWKGSIDERAYYALINYQVEITD